mmetsp:Transcript_15420/g.36612  ORF Transcript_15420/g.36612 Transcript_15420/m.36612 type:complete len:492 (+) Transcript_15420:26-1501(+)
MYCCSVISSDVALELGLEVVDVDSLHRRRHHSLLGLPPHHDERERGEEHRAADAAAHARDQRRVIRRRRRRRRGASADGRAVAALEVVIHRHRVVGVGGDGVDAGHVGESLLVKHGLCVLDEDHEQLHRRGGGAEAGEELAEAVARHAVLVAAVHGEARDLGGAEGGGGAGEVVLEGEAERALELDHRQARLRRRQLQLHRERRHLLLRHLERRRQHRLGRHRDLQLRPACPGPRVRRRVRVGLEEHAAAGPVLVEGDEGEEVDLLRDLEEALAGRLRRRPFVAGVNPEGTHVAAVERVAGADGVDEADGELARVGAVAEDARQEACLAPVLRVGPVRSGLDVKQAGKVIQTTHYATEIQTLAREYRARGRVGRRHDQLQTILLVDLVEIGHTQAIHDCSVEDLHGGGERGARAARVPALVDVPAEDACLQWRVASNWARGVEGADAKELGGGFELRDAVRAVDVEAERSVQFVAICVQPVRVRVVVGRLR